MSNPAPHTYFVQQLGAPDARLNQWNVPVVSFEDLLTHHPGDNRSARLKDGVPVQVEDSVDRSYGVVGGEFQELQTLRTDNYQSLQPNQVLIVKDFILEDSTRPTKRAVDVPAPMPGTVGRVDARNGVVDICDPTDRSLVVRIRHLGPISVAVGDTVAYGQSLGTQNNIGLKPSNGKHVHVEMDTRYYQQLDNYIQDLVDGRLPVQAEHRVGVLPRVVVQDGVYRVGESGRDVEYVQRALAAGGYKEVGDVPIAIDGVYRTSMQGAVLAFQKDHGLTQSGDIDAGTLRTALDLTLGKPLAPPPVIDGDSPAAFPLRHPRHAMLEQIRGHVASLDAAKGRQFDATSERMSHALLRLAAEQRMDSVDHVLLGKQTSQLQAGERVFLVQGRLDDPAQLRTSMATDVATSTSIAQSLQQVRDLDEHARAYHLHQDPQRAVDPAQSRPALS